jgi:threonine aldolase
MARHANAMAAKLAAGIASGGYGLAAEAETYQVIPILPNSVVAALRKHFSLYVWGKSDDEHSVIRLVTSWTTEKGKVDAFLSRLASA